MNLSLILLDAETEAFGAVFTRNAFPGAPILYGRRCLERKTMGGIIVNNRIANVCAPGGMEDIEAITGELGRLTGRPPGSLFAASTGIIGWKLPRREITDSLPLLVTQLNRGSILPLAEAIMTTDRYPKVRAANVCGGRIVGIAKGAGMIEPNMATMLCFILTDLRIDRDALRSDLARSVDRSFNRISVDGDQSTSDTVILMSSQRGPSPEREEFGHRLLEVCEKLAEDVVRNGEGVQHVVRVSVSGCPNDGVALGAAKAIVNSPLVKTAIYGNDPNVGRLLSALGDFFGNQMISVRAESLSIRMGEVEVFSEGVFRLDQEKEEKLSRYLRDCGSEASVGGFPQHERVVEIEVDVGLGRGRAGVTGGDLTDGYVEENARYRS